MANDGYSVRFCFGRDAVASDDNRRQTRGVSQDRRFHQLRAAASSREGLAGMSEDDFAEWLAVARANAADSRHGKAAAKDWQKLTREAEAESRRRSAPA
jgi:hypothetical protein